MIREMAEARFFRTDHPNGYSSVFFDCPGCKFLHSIRIKPDGWEWNGDLVLGTFSPSLLVRWPDGRCHSFIRDGRIQFLSDSTHDLAGQTVDIPTRAEIEALTRDADPPEGGRAA